IYIVEGDSAGGSAKQGRDRRFQAILPIRGKILNVEKARLDKMLSSEEIKTMIAALGCGIGTEDFDLSKLRYHRVIIMTDADVDGSHIRTLLLTFFYRQMPALIENGHMFIAQPPLFRAKRGRVETYIKDERALETFLAHRAVESRLVRLADGQELFGETLEQMLQAMIGYQKVMQAVERRGHGKDVAEALLDRDVRDKSFFENRTALDELAVQLTTDLRDVTLVRDEEHNTWTLRIEDRSGGYSRIDHIGIDFVTSGEYRTLASSYADVRDVIRAIRQGPIEVRVLADEPEAADESVQAEDARAHGEGDEALTSLPTEDGALIEAVRRAEADAEAQAGGPTPAASTPDKGAVEMRSSDQFVEYFIALGRKGIAVNRYKGLGEMNPDTLWATTMNPESRTLLEVKAEDHTEADQMFTTLMGDHVEPRRKFIEENALDVRNLDI
ncbi:MAG: toprim domain-containing protein, partial [Vicinamibacterales bacterium]